ncbi:MAG: DNA adenine methylase [Mycoplasma sp.]
MKITPFVKWVGGKRVVIEENLKFLLPETYNRYLEPFVGGGAMLWHLQPKEALINDINDELITSYKIIKKDPTKLLKELDMLKEKHDEDFFCKIRATLPTTDLEKATRFIYLNKTCFNGMYRVNSKGLFNVPSGKKIKEKVSFYSLENIQNMNEYMKASNLQIFNQDYYDFLDNAQSGDFVFVDSPYHYEEGVNGFVSYSKNGFGDEQQIRLANKMKELHEKGVKFMITNNSTKLIKELFKDFKIIEIKTNRSINSDGNNRNKAATEVVVVNY